jgi:2-polyprenyl-6-methoxyphenol hydroxylase-like FAD-dependent oxidoreductase
MRKILIVGAGQAGLQLAHGLLLAGGYEVTVMSQRPAGEIRQGRVTSTQWCRARSGTPCSRGGSVVC